MASVTNVLAMDRTTLTAALKPLHRRGLVKVAQDTADRRGRLLSLTAKGTKLLASATPIWEQTHRAMEAQLTDIDPERLRNSLRSLA
jgi:DNA-binding MarR family transcriptional regulator